MFTFKQKQKWQLSSCKWGQNLISVCWLLLWFAFKRNQCNDFGSQPNIITLNFKIQSDQYGEEFTLISSIEWSRWWYIAMVRDDKNDVRILMIAMTMVCMISVSFCDKGVFFQHSGHLCLDIASWLKGERTESSWLLIYYRRPFISTFNNSITLLWWPQSIILFFTVLYCVTAFSTKKSKKNELHKYHKSTNIMD